LRLDLFLKLSRLCPRRTIAQKLCDAGIVFINGRPAKSAHVVRVGDVITIRRYDHEIVIRVLIVPAARGVSRHDARQLIEVISEKSFEPVGG
jgi:ribosomal 50S subunit-recycling heat shock protein